MLVTSYVPGEGCPELFYTGAGLGHTGRVDDGEVVIEFNLAGVPS